MTAVTCHTEGCGNAEKPIELDLTFVDDDGAEQPITAVVCGVCGHAITDLGGESAPADESEGR
jgi:hypothetical protein